MRKPMLRTNGSQVMIALVASAATALLMYTQWPHPSHDAEVFREAVRVCTTDPRPDVALECVRWQLAPRN